MHGNSMLTTLIAMWLLFETTVPPSLLHQGKWDFIYIHSASFVQHEMTKLICLTALTSLHGSGWRSLYTLTVNQGGGQEILDVCHIWHLRCDNILFRRIFAGLSVFSEAKRVKASGASSFICSVLSPGEGVTKHCFMTIILISFLTYRKNMCTERWNAKSFLFFSQLQNLPLLRSKFRLLPVPSFSPTSGTPVPTTTCSVRTWSTARSTPTSPSTSSTPATCGDCGTWSKATLRRISSPILPRLAS